MDVGECDEHWRVAIFSARESFDTLQRCLRATLHALDRVRGSAVLDVIVNGNRSLAEAAARWIPTASGLSPKASLRVWFIPQGDKANAWNEYVHAIADDAALAFFVDGYVELQPDALRCIADAMAHAPSALAATGLPTSGRGAAALRAQFIRDGGLHGNLFALRASTLGALRDRGFRLPRGIYRGDAVLGAVLSFRLDPATHAWDRSSIFTVPSATWRVAGERWWSPSGLVKQIKRRFRQAQGHIETRAVREHLSVARRAPETLAPTALALVDDWCSRTTGLAAAPLSQRLLARHVLRRLRGQTEGPAEDRRAQLLFSRHP